jgi:hypothetical protein
MNIVLSLCEKSRSTYPKKPCLENLFGVFINHNIYILGDDLSEDMMDFLKSYNVTVDNQVRGKDKYMIDKFEFCRNNFKSDDIVYMVEDDYMHYSGSDILFEEGLQHADYVTLYDHPDKYSQFIHPNPELTDVGENTIVFLTKSSHWKYTNSTTGTFAFKHHTLIEDYDIWIDQVINNIWGYDYQGFINIRKNNRKVASCIPGRSSHMYPELCHTPFFKIPL